MERIDMSKRVSLPAERPQGTYVGKLRGMLVYLEGDVGDYIINVTVYHNQKVSGGKYRTIAQLSLSTDYADGAYHVDLMRIDYRFQGHGIAPLIYRYVMRKLGIILQAGTSQSAGGRKLWAQLVKMKDITVFAQTRRGKAHILELDKDDEELHCESLNIYDGHQQVYTFAMAV